MKYIKMIWHFIRRVIIGIWDFFFFFFGMPYESQAKKLNWDEHDAAFRGPENPKTKTTIYRANKVSKNQK